MLVATRAGRASGLVVDLIYMKKIVIVTPELAGLFKNGGIGTNYFNRARYLSGKLGWQVTILYTGKCTAVAVAAWREKHGRPGLRLEFLPDLPEGMDWASIQQRAWRVHEWLAPQVLDEIHFPEYLANGLVCLQAKQAGLAYRHTRLVVMLHSSLRWCREGMKQWSTLPETDVKLDYAERFCGEHADTLTSPSVYMLQWAQQCGWRLPENRLVLPSLYEPPVAETPLAPLNSRQVIFFGRLETRKGLGIFCEAIDRLCQAGQAPERVDFLGKFGWHEGVPAEPFLRRRIKAWGKIEVRIYADFDSFTAVDHIRKTGGLVVMPSLSDNLPYAVIECIGNGFPFIATNVGGIPELADAGVLCAPDVASLTAKLAVWVKQPPVGPWAHPYTIQSAQARWQVYVNTPFVSPPVPTGALPKISVCISCYNLGRYLPDVLASLARQTYVNFEVIVVDDGSTEAASLEHFQRMEKAYPQYRFLRQANGGVSAARNFAVAQSTGEWLVFMDADNVARETMLAGFAQALQVSGSDCATCYFEAFYDDLANLQKPPAYRAMPLGPSLEAGWRENVFGDANFIVKKSVFQSLGGFAGDCREDWEFLVRLTARGFRQIVVPENLFWYRHRADSMMRTSDELWMHWGILETYRKELSDWPGRVIDHFVFEPHLRRISGQTLTFTHSPAALEQKRLASKKPRKKWLRKFKRSTVKRLLKLAGWIDRQ